MFENADLPPRAAQSKANARPTRRANALPGLALSFIFVLGLNSGCQTPYESGMSEYRSGQYTVAEQHAKRGLSEDPEDPELNLLLARALVAQKNYRDAEAYAEVAFRSGERTGEAGRILGKIQWELGRTMDAAASWQRAREAQPASVSDEDYQRALESALRTAVSIQNFEKSLDFRLALAEFAPEHAQATAALIRQNREQHAAQLMRQGAFEKSADVYETLLEAQPDNEAYLLSLGQLHEKLGRVDASRVVYDRYLQLAPEQARATRMIELANQAAAPENIQFYRLRAYEALEPIPSRTRATLAMQLASHSFEENRDEDAKRYFEQYLSDMTALSQDPAGAEVYFHAADVASRHNRPKYALELLERGQALAPTNWQLTEQLAGLYTRRARSADVERVLSEFVDNSNEPFEARLLVARWANARRNYDLAQHFMERALEDRNPEDTQIWLELANIYAAQGRTDRLKVALTNYTKPTKRTYYELITAANIYQQARLYKEAEELLIRSQKAEPRELRILDALANLYQDWAKPEKMEHYYDRWIAAGGNKAEDFTTIGGRLIQQNDLTRAITYLRKGAEAGDVEAWLRIASIFSQQRRNIDMREALQHYVDASEQPADALRSAQHYYRNAGMASDEIEVLETLLSGESSDIFNDVNDHTRLAELYLQQGREDAATALWTDYLSQAPDFEDRLNDAAKWFERNGDPRWTLSVYTRLFQGANPNPIIYKFIGDTYLSIAEKEGYRRTTTTAGMSSDALERARHFYRLYLQNGVPSRTELVDFATTMARKQQWAVAAEAYQTLLEEQPDSAPLWLNYGEALLKTGQAKEGIRVLARYAAQRKSSPTDIQRVGDALASAQLYREAQPYFEQIFESASAAQSQKIYAFRRLAEAYQATRRTEEIPALAERYLAQSQNPTEARREVLNILNSAGMYAEAVEQITRIRASQGDILGRELAENYFHNGQFDEAYEAFKKVAQAHAYPGDAWVEVAQFYTARARAERAEQAFKEAVRAAPENANVHLNYAFFLLRQGELERGLESLESTRARATEGQREDVEFAAAQVLNEIGRFDLSAEIARASLERGTQGHRDDFTLMLATYQLATLPAEQAQRSVELLKKSGLPLRTRIQLLMDNGYETQAAQWLEEAMSQSSYYNASQILQSNAALVTATGGFNALEMAFKPLLDRQDESANANASLGYALMRQGEFARAIPYLKAAESNGFSPATSLLADAYGGLELDAQALQQYQKIIATTPEVEVAETLKKIGSHLELIGQNDAFIRLLRTLTNDTERAAAAMPILAKSLIQSGQIAQAFDLIYRLVPAAHQTSETPAPLTLDLSRDADMTLLVGLLNALAEEGYIIEARATLERLTGHLSEEMRQDPRLRNLALRLSASAPAELEAIEKRAASDTNAPHEASTAALQSARILLINGHFEAAESVAREAFPNATADAQKDIGDFLLSNMLASGDLGRLDEVARSIIENSGNQLEATKRVEQRLRALGQDTRAFALAQTLAEEQPTGQNVQRALARAQTTEDIDAVTKGAARLLQVGDNPSATLKSMLVPHYYQHPAELSRALYAPLLSIEPATVESRLFNIFMDFRAGDVEAGREGIRTYVEAVHFDPYAVQLLLARLDHQRLFVESARVLAPALEGHALSALSKLYIGFAQHEIGELDAAKTELAQYIARSPDAARAASKIALLMVATENFEDARDYAEQAIAAQPTFLTPYYYRGIAQITLGEIEAGKADLAKSIGPGVDRFYGIYGAAYHALKAGHDELAVDYIEALIRAPMITLNYPGAQLAIRAFLDADRAEFGVAYLEKNYPQIATGTGNLGEAMLTAMSNLYSAAGRNDRAHELYETAITRLLAADPLGDRTVTYMNNLAYGYASEASPEKADLAKGFELVRRAIAGTNERSTSYLDTLGWLYFRSHDLDRAETYIRGSLATSTSPENSIGELIDHIIAIDEARGNADDASWLYIYRQNLD